jgi:hypothetical protein
VQFIRHHDQRKEQIVARIVEKRGEGPGLVAILSAMETCESYEARYDQKTGRTSLRRRRAKCLHYYFYFIDEQLGLCFMRMSTWCPFAAQAYFNGHNLLAAKLRKAGISYRMLDNAFTHIGDWEAAQKLADESDSRLLHAKLDEYARLFCPALETLGVPRRRHGQHRAARRALREVHEARGAVLDVVRYEERGRSHPRPRPLPDIPRPPDVSRPCPGCPDVRDVRVGGRSSHAEGFHHEMRNVAHLSRRSVRQVERDQG